MLKKDQILLSGLMPIKKIEQEWCWTSSDNPDSREEYLRFIEYIEKNFNYNQEPLRCVFIVACLPRNFLEKYSKVEQLELGFIEYRVPMYSQIFNIPFCMEHSFNHCRNFDLSKQNPALNAGTSEVSRRTILKHLLNPKGTRVFHPYRRISPISKGQWYSALTLEAFRRGFKVLKSNG